MDCPRFPPLPRPPIRPLLGAGASIGPVRVLCAAAAVACGGAGAVALGILAAQPPAIVRTAEPVPIPAPGGVLFLALGVVALVAVRR